MAQRLATDLATVDEHGVGRLDERVQLAAHAVDGDAPRLDQLVGPAAGRDAGTGEVGVEAHGAILARRYPAARAGARRAHAPPRRPDRRLRRERPAGQIVGVTTYVGKEALTREVTRAAYERGARWVDVTIFDPWLKRERLLHADAATLDYIPPWMTERLEWLSDERAARIALNGPASPDALDGIDPSRAGRDILPYLPNTGDVVNRATTNWCVAPAPSPGWAGLVFPELERDEAFDRLWEAIAHICRLDEADPEEAWRARAATLEARRRG